MLKKLLMSAVAIIPFFSSAQNGYWEQRQVCDYEQIVTNIPKTDCRYSGYVNADFPSQVAQGEEIQYTSFQRVLSNHVNCPSYVHQSLEAWVLLSSGINGLASYQGNVPLTNQTHRIESTTQTIVVPGSCRTEWVWIPLCDRCQIP